MKYFNQCKCIEKLKKVYRGLCQRYHPDKCKDENATRIMQEINAEYDVMFKRLKDVHHQKTSNEEKQENKGKNQSNQEVPEELKEIIQKVQTLENCTVEIIGTWIWINGNTYQHKALLNDLKFKYHRTKKSWYFTNDTAKKKTRKNFSLDEIRDIYGSKKVKKEVRPKIEQVAS